ncbi:protein-L-isoaspartate O-methyltransferase family protein [Nonomuraea sp. CA-143628]|uniref:protein-L-isoaspartate O-methyltransferase family protein n=1 Tax=Nonomuraea sp. CA-143628 TaxID=3239997 RepID=UPI003D8CD3BB
MSLTPERLDRLLAALDPEGSGDIGEPIKGAVRKVPRHLFIPPVGLVVEDGPPYLINRDVDPGTWWDSVYSRSIIVTQLDDGATELTALKGDSTSSASAPSTVADLLQRLQTKPGMKVLEVGTGTGWTAGLLSHLVADHGEVTSIEVDAAVADQAGKNLAAAAVHPHLVIGDGAFGCPEHAPYDRVHVTCGIRDIPYAWVEQCRVGAVIVLPWHPGYGTSHCLRLEVQEDGTALGRVVGFAGYMMMRSQRPHLNEDQLPGQERRHYRTALDPRALDQLSAGADLAIAALTGVRSHTSTGTDDEGEYVRMWVSDPADSHSWAVATWRPDSVDYGVQQVGDRPMWDEVVQAYARWVSWGEPRWERFGVTVTPEGQRVWLDTPEVVLNSA